MHIQQFNVYSLNAFICFRIAKDICHDVETHLPDIVTGVCSHKLWETITHLDAGMNIIFKISYNCLISCM